MMKTYAPSVTNCFAVARPMPLVPPVMRAILPLSFPMSPSGGGVTRSRRAGSRVDDALEHGPRQGADDPVGDHAVLEEEDRRNRPDFEPGRQGWALVDVDLHQG